jgi:hypothetical protein
LTIFANFWQTNGAFILKTMLRSNIYKSSRISSREHFIACFLARHLWCKKWASPVMRRLRWLSWSV